MKTYIKQGDCLELMKEIPDKAVDMVLCDLPYGITKCQWDKVLPFCELWHNYRRIVKPNGTIALFSNQPFTTKLIGSNLQNYKYSWYWIKQNSTGFQFAKYQPMRKVEDINIFLNNSTDNKGQYLQTREYLQAEREKSGLQLSDFKKLIGTNMAGHYFTSGKQFTLPNAEAYKLLQTTGYFQMPYKELQALYKSEKIRYIAPTYNPQGLKEYDKPIKVVKNRKKEDSVVPDTIGNEYIVKYYNYPNNILQYGYDKDRVHPTQKPVPLLEYLIKTYTNEGQTVLDNCMGSGSTGVAAVNTGRQFIGFELNPQYYETAKNRIETAQRSAANI